MMKRFDTEVEQNLIYTYDSLNLGLWASFFTNISNRVTDAPLLITFICKDYFVVF